MKEPELDVMDLLDKSFERLKRSLLGKGNRFCIPISDNSLRISEQEIKCCFIETFIEEAPDKYLYSVETPTIESYRFTQSGKQIMPHKDNNSGRRGNIDVVIFQGGNKDENRISIIEFKANIVDDFKHAKDFCKLKEEPGIGVQRFFVELFVIKDGNEREKLKKKLFNNTKGNLGKNTIFIGYGLNLDSINDSYKITRQELEGISLSCAKKQ